MLKKTIALDLDSVLADVMVTWINEYNIRYKAKVIKDNITGWDITKILSISPDESEKIFNFVWKRRWKEIPLTEKGNSTIISDLRKKDYRISIITKRDKTTIEYVLKWLSIKKIECDDLICIFDGRAKSEFPFEIIIDDYIQNLKHIKYPKIGILYTQPWNRRIRWPNRINNLNEISKFL